MVESLQVELGEGRAYPIHFGMRAREDAAALVGKASEEGRSVVTVMDSGVEAALPSDWAGLLKGMPRYLVASGETSKSLKEFEQVCRFLAKEGMHRDGMVLTVGGGVTGDLAGFAAAAYLRGIDFHQVPTTLLAMVDSSVGGKTGVNLPEGKNLVGAFHQPCSVFIDPDFLRTLPNREFSAGMAEVIKTGLLGDRSLFEQLESTARLHAGSPELPAIIRTCCKLKAEVVGADEKETAATGGRALLNLGHTFAHAVEATAGYGEYLHGEAVGLGLVLAARLSVELGLIQETDAERIRLVVEKYGLPSRLKQPFPPGALMKVMLRDKKVKAGRLRFVVMEEIGRAATREGIDSALIEKLWAEAGADKRAREPTRRT